MRENDDTTTESESIDWGTATHEGTVTQKLQPV